MKKVIFVSIIAVIISISCSKSGSTGGTTGGGGGGGGGGGTTVNCSTVTNKAFAADVAPIISSSCAIASCHAAGSSNGPGALTTYAQISSAGSLIKSAVAAGRMPQSGTLTTAQKNTIICWVDSGTPNN